MTLDRNRKLSLGERVLIWIVTGMSRLTYGVRVPFAEDLVRTHGVVEMFKWMGEADKVAADLGERFGKTEAQMVIAMSGLWAGCRWCSTGHMLGANLLIFKDGGQLGPIDELELAGWQELEDSEVIELLHERLTGRWSHMIPLAERLLALRAGEVEPESDDDFLLERTNVMWEWVVECTIMGVDLEPSWIPAFQFRRLKERYRKARERAALVAR